MNEEFSDEEEHLWSEEEVINNQRQIDFEIRRMEIEDKAIDYYNELKDKREFDLPNIYPFIKWYAMEYHGFQI